MFPFPACPPPVIHQHFPAAPVIQAEMVQTSHQIRTYQAERPVGPDTAVICQMHLTALLVVSGILSGAESVQQ